MFVKTIKTHELATYFGCIVPSFSASVWPMHNYRWIGLTDVLFLFIFFLKDFPTVVFQIHWATSVGPETQV